jgi:ATP-dependent protease HslVU (ClpYQ) peptidase subunit
MTTLAGIQGNGWAVLGCDSRATLEGGRIIEIGTAKVIENNGILIAGAGSGRGSNILHFGWEAPRPVGKVDLDEWMTKTFVPSMRKAFIDAGYDAKAEDSAAEHDSEFLICVKSRLYYLFDDYSWDRDTRGIFTCGSGGELALGALDALNAENANTPETATKKMKQAITTAIKYDSNSGGNVLTFIQRA